MTRRALGAPRRDHINAMRRASTRSYVYGLLRQAIVSAEFTPGQALSENELAALHGVSRTPVREALIRLADEGLVDVVPQLGTFVSRIRVSDVIEAQFIRETLELASLPHAVERVDAEGERRLRRVLAEQDDAREGGDLQRWFATDEDLHQSLLEIGGHPRVWPIVSSAKAHLDRVRMLTLPDTELLRELHAEHTAIVDHVVAGRHQEAEKALRHHLQLALALLAPLEERHPDYFILDDAEDRPADSRRLAERPRR
jgi:DNA-binding GntR family transcriptional regulator